MINSIKLVPFILLFIYTINKKQIIYKYIKMEKSNSIDKIEETPEINLDNEYGQFIDIEENLL
jgi:hypothetical protein